MEVTFSLLQRDAVEEHMKSFSRPLDVDSVRVRLMHHNWAAF